MTVMTTNDVHKMADYLANNLTPQQIMAVATEALNVHNIMATFSVTNLTDPIAVEYDTIYGRTFVGSMASFCNGSVVSRAVLDGEVQACSAVAREEADRAVGEYRRVTQRQPQVDELFDFSASDTQSQPRQAGYSYVALGLEAQSRLGVRAG